MYHILKEARRRTKQTFGILDPYVLKGILRLFSAFVTESKFVSRIRLVVELNRRKLGTGCNDSVYTRYC